MSVLNILSRNPSGNILVWISCYPMKTTECTLSCGSSEKFDCAASDIRMCIIECTPKCCDSVSVKYPILKTICEYFGVNILLSHGAHLELWQQWKFQPHFLWQQNLYHWVHVQVQWWCQCQISCPETPLGIFWCEYLVIPWKQQSAPWAVAAVKNSTTLLLTWKSVSLSACTSAVMMSVSNILSQNPSRNILVWISCYPMKTTECTLTCGSSENFNHTASSLVICITECMYKCSDDVSVKYLVPKPVWEYFGVNILLSHENNKVHLEL